MKNDTSRILALLLSFVLAMSLCACGAKKEDGKKARPTATPANTYESCFEYELLEDGSAIITRFSNDTATVLNIPAQLDGHPVTMIGEEAFKDNQSLTEVTVPEGITDLCNLAFSGCKNLAYIRIPNSLRRVSRDAFDGCSADFRIAVEWEYDAPQIRLGGLNWTYTDDVVIGETYTYRRLPDGTVEILRYWGLQIEDVVKVPSSFEGRPVSRIGEYAMRPCSAYSIIIPEGVTSIGNLTFFQNTFLDSITLPKSVKSIGEDAFSCCVNLKEIVIPGRVSSIEKGTFIDCRSLQSVTLPKGIVTIGVAAFQGCHSLSDITLPDGITTIGDRAFFDCPELMGINLPDSVTSIGEYAFGTLETVYDAKYDICYYVYHENPPDGFVFTVGHGSYAEQYCIRNGFEYVYRDDAVIKWLF